VAGLCIRAGLLWSAMPNQVMRCVFGIPISWWMTVNTTFWYLLQICGQPLEELESLVWHSG
jgi:hypothetical protein